MKMRCEIKKSFYWASEEWFWASEIIFTFDSNIITFSESNSKNCDQISPKIIENHVFTYNSTKYADNVILW